jgi:hypothetical protein
MRVNGWPRDWKESEGWLPVDLREIDLHASPTELRSLASFLAKAADELEAASQIPGDYRSAVDFVDNEPNAELPIVFEVVGGDASPA